MAGLYVLNPVASRPDVSGETSIGAILRKKKRPNAPMEVIAYISRAIGKVDVQVAEYRALIEGLRLAERYRPIKLYVFVDSAVIAELVTGKARTTKKDLKLLRDEACQLISKIGKEHVRVGWLPRELNSEANQRASDAFFVRLGNARVHPRHMPE